MFGIHYVANIFDSIGSFHPVIEYVEEVRNNPRDHTGVTFIAKGDPTQIIKWCRRNFGSRGDGWDFMGGTRHVQVTIWSSRLITMWELWQE